MQLKRRVHPLPNWMKQMICESGNTNYSCFFGGLSLPGDSYCIPHVHCIPVLMLVISVLAHHDQS